MLFCVVIKITIFAQILNAILCYRIYRNKIIERQIIADIHGLLLGR